MRLAYLTSVAIIPLMIFTANFDQGNSQKDKGNKEQKNHGKGGGKDHDERRGKDHDGNKGNEKRAHTEEPHGNSHSKNNSKQKDNNWKNKGDKAYKNKKWKATDRWDDGKWDNERFDVRMAKIKGHKKHNWVNERYYQGINWWDGDRYYDVKNPKGNKKITLCHKPNGSDYPVTISVSVNALKAHLNHGDYEGNCKDWDRSKYSDTYWTTRTDYYNQYVQTTETLSFGEQLLALAINKLTGARTQLNALRPTLTQTEITSREVAIINLQNDSYAMQQTLERGNNSIATVNFVF